MLTKQQIQYLFTFCESNGVKYYDVQVELVDHFVNAIETEMRDNTQLTFEKALKKVYRSFGNDGFEPLVNEKEKMAEKQIKRLFWKLFKSHFGWPKILFFLLLATILFTLFSFKIFFVKWFLMVTLLLGSGIILYTPFLEGMISGAGKKFLLVSFLWVPSSIVFLPCLLYLQGLAGTKSFLTHIPPHILIPGISILLSFNLIAICVAWQTFNSIKKNLYQTYPEVFSTAK